MIGQNVDDIVSKPNITTLQQRSRRKDKERPSGRKQPRIKDFAKSRGKKGSLYSYEYILYIYIYIYTYMNKFDHFIKKIVIIVICKYVFLYYRRGHK